CELAAGAEGAARPGVGLAQPVLPALAVPGERRGLPARRRPVEVRAIAAPDELDHRGQVGEADLADAEAARRAGHGQRSPSSRRARSTASAGSLARSTPASPGPPGGGASSQLAMATTLLPSRRACAISDSVPQPPPTAITALADATTARLRAWPRPVATTCEQCSLASPGSAPGRIPITVPPAPAAPRAAASIAPPSPPHTTTAPASASRRPTSSASAATSGAAAPGPMTAIAGARFRVASPLAAPARLRR